jgi:hypothetical protein
MVLTFLDQHFAESEEALPGELHAESRHTQYSHHKITIPVLGLPSFVPYYELPLLVLSLDSAELSHSCQFRSLQSLF